MKISEKQKFVLNLVKVAAGVAGGALVLTENHPYIALIVLVVGAIANEALTYNQTK